MTGVLTLISIALIRPEALVSSRLCIPICRIPIAGLHGRSCNFLCDLSFLAPSGELPTCAADVAAWMEDGHSDECERHHRRFKDHERDLIVGELASEAVDQFGDTIGGADEDEAACGGNCWRVVSEN